MKEENCNINHAKHHCLPVSEFPISFASSLMASSFFLQRSTPTSYRQQKLTVSSSPKRRGWEMPVLVNLELPPNDTHVRPIIFIALISSKPIMCSGGQRCACPCRQRRCASYLRNAELFCSKCATQTRNFTHSVLTVWLSLYTLSIFHL